MKPARGESCHSRQRRGPAAPREDKYPSPDQKSFHISTTPTTWGQKRRSPGSLPLRPVWKRRPDWLVADLLRLMEPARGESCTSCQCRGLGALGAGKLLSPDHKSFHKSASPANRGRKRRSRGSLLLRTVWKPQPHLWLLIGWGSCIQCGESYRSGQRRDPAAPGDDKVSSPEFEILPYLFDSNNPRVKAEIPRVDTAPHGVETPTPLADC